MVPGTPQWPQWLASADKALNGFSRNLIAPQSPKDKTRLELPLQSPTAAEFESKPASPFSSGPTFDLLKFFLQKSTARARGKTQTTRQLRLSQKKSNSQNPTDQANDDLSLTDGKLHFDHHLSLSALTLLYQVSSQWGSLLLNFQPDSSYQWCPILMIHTTRWLFLSGNFLLPHRLEAVGKGRYLVACRIVSDGPEKGSKITALSPKSLADTDTLKATTQDLGIVGPETNLIQHPDAQGLSRESRWCDDAGGAGCVEVVSASVWLSMMTVWWRRTVHFLFPNS